MVCLFHDLINDRKYRPLKWLLLMRILANQIISISAALFKKKVILH